MNLIDEIKNIILDKGLTVSKGWAEDIAISLVSTFSFNAHTYTKQGKIRPNLWFLYLGASRIAFKTLPLKAFYIPILEQFKNNGLDLLLPTSFSMEGMVECLSKTQKRGVVIRDEFSTFLKGKDYLSDLMEFLSQLYDGFVQRRYTRKEKLEDASGFYVNVIGTSTEYLYTILKPDFFMQGVGNRFLYTLWEGESKKWNDDDLFLDPKYKEIPSELLEKLKLITKARYVVPVSKKLLELMNRYTEEAVKLQKEGKSLEASYRQDFIEKLIKLSMLRSIGDNLDKIQKGKEPPIIDHHVEWAEKKIENYWNNFLRLLHDWRKQKLKREEPIITVDTQVEMVYDTIKTYYEKEKCGVSMTELYRMTKMKKDQLSTILYDYLIPDGRVEMKREETAGRPKTIFIPAQ